MECLRPTFSNNIDYPLSKSILDQECLTCVCSSLREFLIIQEHSQLVSLGGWC